MQIINPPGGSASVSAPVNLSAQSNTPYLKASAPTSDTDYGYRGKRGHWSMGVSAPVAQPGGNRGDAAWFLGYGLNESGQNGQGLADALVGEEEQGFFIRYEDYYERNAPYSAGTVSGTSWNAATGTTTLTGSGTTWTAGMGNGLYTIRFTTSGKYYEVVSRASNTSIDVRGDATGESGAYVISEEFTEWHMGSLAHNKTAYADGRQAADNFVTRRIWNCQISKNHPWITLDLIADAFAISASQDPIAAGTTPEPLFQVRAATDRATTHYIKAATWTVSTKTLTCTGAFTNFQFRPGQSKIRILSGTGATLGEYTVASRTSADAITLSTNIAAGDLATGDITAIIHNPKRGEVNINAAHILMANGCNYQGRAGNGTAYNMMSMSAHATLPIMVLGQGAMDQISISPKLLSVGDSTNGLKIGGATTEKIGLWNKTPVVQPAHANQAAVVGTASGTYGATEQTLLNAVVTLVNQIRSDLVSFGAIKGSA